MTPRTVPTHSRTSLSALVGAVALCIACSATAQEPPPVPPTETLPKVGPTLPKVGPEPLPTSRPPATRPPPKVTPPPKKKVERRPVRPRRILRRVPCKRCVTELPSWIHWLPRVSLLARGGLGFHFNNAPAPTGFGDVREGGIVFQLLEAEVTQNLGKHVRIGTDVLFDEEGVYLEEAWLQLRALPAGLGSRMGLMKSRIGFDNERSRDQQEFVDQPLALGKFFGDFGHRMLGGELSIRLPVSWTFDLYVAAMAAGGRGQRSWFFEDDVEIDSPVDLAYQFGLENVWDAGSVEIGFELNATVGPNNTGRGNGTDIWGAAFSVAYLAADPKVGVGFRFETEWYLRRRQVPADVLQDLAGWASAGVTIGHKWAIAARYELAQGVDDDFLDPEDDVLRRRASAVVRWMPIPYFKIRATGYADIGGPLDDESYGFLIHFEAGYNTHSHGGAGGIR